MFRLIILLLIEAFCVVNLAAQKSSFLFEPNPNAAKEFWKDWSVYAHANPQIPIQFSDGPLKDCSFDGFAFNGQPQFLCTCNNLDAAKTIGTQNLWLGGSLGLNLSGVGMNKLALWDGGSARQTHVEFGGRVVVIDTPSAVSGHTTAVVGNLMAAGLNPNVKGMSYQTQLRNWNFTNDNAEIIAAAPSLFLSNHSYVSVCGWTYIGSNLYWYGDSSLNMYRDYKYGFYNDRTRIWDSVMYQNPYYLMVKAAGNDRGLGVAPGSTHYYWNGSAWALTNTTRDSVGPYDCISTFGCAKNILTVGAINVMPNGYTGSSAVAVLSYSAWGPTDDGRIKPDLVAASGSILSTGTANDSAYSSLGGTSIASPNVTGSLLLLQEYFYQLKGRYMRNATLKGLAIHSADRCKNSPGPDYECGWGVPNMTRAAMCLKDSIRNTVLENSLANNDSFAIRVLIATGDSLRLTLAWTDPKGITTLPLYNDTTPKLVNDLDLRVLDSNLNIVAMPFVLNPASPASPATTGDNRRDNIEQIYSTSLSSGKYWVKVKHKGQLQNQNAQSYSLIISGAPLYAATLPVTWVSLNAKQESWNEASIYFTVSREMNNHHFEIEFSEDGTVFSEVGSIYKVAGNSNKINVYRFLHRLNHGFQNTSFYRIKQVDYDGNIAYSKVFELKASADWSYYLITPNPFTEQITVSMFSKNNSENTFKVYNMFGECVHNEKRNVFGLNAIMLNLFSLPNGMYILEITESNSTNKVYQTIVKE